jgi:hypothetical protein
MAVCIMSPVSQGKRRERREQKETEYQKLTF